MSNKELNFLQLPCVSTLKQHINFTNMQTGFNPDILKRLADDAKVTESPDREKLIVMAFDEMQIKSNLVYHKGR